MPSEQRDDGGEYPSGGARDECRETWGERETRQTTETRTTTGPAGLEDTKEVIRRLIRRRMVVSRSIACCTLSDSAMYSCGTDEDPRVCTEKKLTLLLQYASLV